MKVEIDSMVVAVAIKDAQFHNLSPILVAVKDAQFQSFRKKNIIKLDAQFDQRIGSKLHQIPNQPTQLNKNRTHHSIRDRDNKMGKWHTPSNDH